MARADHEEALSEVDKALIRNTHNHRALHLKVYTLHLLNRVEEAQQLVDQALKIDPFNFGALYERYRITTRQADYDSCVARMRCDAHNYEELALDYAACGAWQRVVDLLDMALRVVKSPSAMLRYYQAWALFQLGEKEKAEYVVQQAEETPIGDFFPNRVEAIMALQCAQSLVQHTPHAAYLLGNIWYDKRQYVDAVKAWEQARELSPNSPSILRNLALAYYNKLGKKKEALKLLEQAYHFDTDDARILMELLQLYRRMGRDSYGRFKLLDAHRSVMESRDDLYLEYATLLNDMQRYDEALAHINAHHFHPWEGGEGKIPEQYKRAHLGLSDKARQAGYNNTALHHIDACFSYPHHLGEGKLAGALENDFYYFKGRILEEMGEDERAMVCFSEAAKGDSLPTSALYYNDQKPEIIFYRGMAHNSLGNHNEAHQCFNSLIDFGLHHLNDAFQLDYFAVSLPDLQIWEDNMEQQNRKLCYHLMALGYQGLGNSEQANRCIDKMKMMDRNF